jgi:putative redox protein
VANNVSLTWIEDLRFEGRADDAVVAIDGDGRQGTSPVDLLLESVASCTAADVVDILKKGRQDLQTMTVRVEGDRRDEAPRYVKRVRLKFRMTGDVDEAKAQRAVDLSLEKYCSVFHSLRMDLAVDTEIEIAPGV